jgi:hypothetical protein
MRLPKITLWADVFGLVGVYLPRQAGMPASKRVLFLGRMGEGEHPENETRQDVSA